MVTFYRIIDTAHCGQILAESIPTQEQAQEVLHFLELDHPEIELAIESYTKSTVKPGFGRDPDLHQHDSHTVYHTVDTSTNSDANTAFELNTSESSVVNPLHTSKLLLDHCKLVDPAVSTQTEQNSHRPRCEHLPRLTTQFLFSLYTSLTLVYVRGLCYSVRREFAIQYRESVYCRERGC